MAAVVLVEEPVQGSRVRGVRADRVGDSVERVRRREPRHDRGLLGGGGGVEVATVLHVVEAVDGRGQARRGHRGDDRRGHLERCTATRGLDVAKAVHRPELNRVAAECQDVDGGALCLSGRVEDVVRVRDTGTAELSVAVRRIAAVL